MQMRRRRGGKEERKGKRRGEGRRKEEEGERQRITFQKLVTVEENAQRVLLTPKKVVEAENITKISWLVGKREGHMRI